MDWTNTNDPDSKIAKTKDRDKHLANRAEHAEDLETGTIVAVIAQPARCGDTGSLEETLSEVVENLGSIAERIDLREGALTELATDRGMTTFTVAQLHLEQ